MEENYEHSIFEEAMPVQVVYATFWQRLAALLVDWLVLLPFIALNRYNNTEWKSLPLMIIVSVAARLYKPIFEYLYSATLGKRALSIVVTNAEYGKPGLKDVLLRNSIYLALGFISIVSAAYILLHPEFSVTSVFASPLSKEFSPVSNTLILSGLLSVVYLADVIVFFADRQNRSLHDFIGKTYVVKKWQVM